MPTFAEQVAAFTGKTAEKLDTVAYNATVLIFSSVVFDTPVDTGRLRGSWKPSVGEGDYSLGFVLDPSGEITTAGIQSVVQPGANNFLTNSSEYGYIIEYGLYPNPPKKFTGKTIDGFSTQAPIGMISPNILNWNKTVQAAVTLAS